MTGITGSTGAFYQRSRQDLATLRARTETLQQRISSGQRLARASDDPVAAARLRALDHADAAATATRTNGARVSADLTLTDGALSSVADLVIRAKTLATQAANGTLSTGQQAAIGTELLQIHDQLFALANSQDSTGHALFGGDTPGSAYALNGAGQAVYAGTAGGGTIDVGEGLSVARSMTGPQVFTFSVGGNSTDLFSVVKTLGGALIVGGGSATTAANTAITALGAGLDQVSAQQAIVGARQSFVDTAAARAATVADQRATAQNAIGGTDLASTIADLQNAMTVLQASQASFAKLIGLTLFDQLR